MNAGRLPVSDEHARRVVLALAVGLIAGFCTWAVAPLRQDPSDFGQLWYAGQAWLAGGNPYAVVGPGRAFNWPFPLLYPFPAVLFAIPFGPLPLPLASALFVASGAAAMAYALTSRGVASPHLAVFASGAFLANIIVGQWTPWLIAGVGIPYLGFLLACKPTIGIALFAARPSRSTLWLCAALVAGSLALNPGWLRDWLQALPGAVHVRAPITFVSALGPALLLAATRWRRPEARLLLVLASVPHTTLLYETVLLYLIPRTWPEAATLVVLSWIVGPLPADRSNYVAWTRDVGTHVTALMYLPCLLMVLRRPNVSEPLFVASPVSGESAGPDGQPHDALPAPTASMTRPDIH